MHHFQVGLHLESLPLAGHRALIVASHPIENDGQGVMLTPECASIRELEVQGDELKKKIDAELAKARRKFAASSPIRPR